MTQEPCRLLLQPQEFRADLRLLPNLLIVRLEKLLQGEGRSCYKARDRLWGHAGGLRGLAVPLKMKSSFSSWSPGPLNQATFGSWPRSSYPLLLLLSTNLPHAKPIPAYQLGNVYSLGLEFSSSNFPCLATSCHGDVTSKDNLT